MGLRTAEQFLAGLRDGREVYYRGKRVMDVPDHPELGVVARHVAIDFELAEKPCMIRSQISPTAHCSSIASASPS